MGSAEVTVGMAVYNGETFLAEAVQSVLSQSMQDFVLHIIDDGSTDKSRDIIHSFQDDRIRVTVHAGNRGLPATRNEILAGCDTPFLAWIDQDDLAFPDRLSIQLATMKANPDIAVLGTWARIRTMRPDKRIVFSERRNPLDSRTINLRLTFGCPIVFSTTMMRVSAFREAQISFNEAAGAVLDYELWTRVPEPYTISNLPKTLGEYRLHGNQTSVNPVSRKKMTEGILDLIGALLQTRYHFTWSQNQKALHREFLFSPDFVSTRNPEEIAAWLVQLRELEVSRRPENLTHMNRLLAREILKFAYQTAKRDRQVRKPFQSARKIAEAAEIPTTYIARELFIEAFLRIRGRLRQAISSGWPSKS